jgi:hypothetical protein
MVGAETLFQRLDRAVVSAWAFHVDDPQPKMLWPLVMGAFTSAEIDVVRGHYLRVFPLLLRSPLDRKAIRLRLTGPEA